MEDPARRRRNQAKKTEPRSVVQRLSTAAKRASEKKKRRIQKQEEEEEEDQENDVVKPEEAPPTVSLRQLTRAIDERLRASQNSPEHRNRDSMTSVVRHNQIDHSLATSTNRHHPHRHIVTTKPTSTSDSDPTDSTNIKAKRSADREVAIVLSKPLQQDRITVEYANRIRRLVRAMMSRDDDDDADNDSGVYRPDVICFVGPQSSGNILVDADVGYMYFQYLTAAHGVDTQGIDIHLVKGSVLQDKALQQIAFFLQETCLPLWLRAAATSGPENDTERNDENDSIVRRSPRDRLLRVHFSLISSEYELCQLNDLHMRSPGQSVLRALESWSQRSFTTTWSYMYVTTVLPAQDAKIPAQAFLCKTYKTAQQLWPIIQNLQNVVHNREFFQTESYRVLVAARRSLVSDMEALYKQQPKLKAVHNYRRASADQDDGRSSRPVDVVLEGALLLLGRCVDIVRPAGLLTGANVSLDDWKLALVLLTQAFQAITSVCDPDRPLAPEEWISLGDEFDDDDDYSGSW